jgi:hypothetical protein
MDGKKCRIVSSFLKKMKVSDDVIHELSDKKDPLDDSKEIKRVKQLYYGSTSELNRFFKSERYQSKAVENEREEEEKVDEGDCESRICLFVVTVDVKLSFPMRNKNSKILKVLSAEEVQFPCEYECCFTMMEAKNGLEETIKSNYSTPPVIVKWDHQQTSVGILLNSFDSISDSKVFFYIPFSSKMLSIDYGKVIISL